MKNFLILSNIQCPNTCLTKLVFCSICWNQDPHEVRIPCTFPQSRVSKCPSASGRGVCVTLTCVILALPHVSRETQISSGDFTFCSSTLKQRSESFYTEDLQRSSPHLRHTGAGEGRLCGRGTGRHCPSLRLQGHKAVIRRGGRTGAFQKNT